MSLYHELKRRNVLRVAIAYLALAWLLTEVSGTLFPVFGIPDWGIRLVVIVFALGFLPALIISWVYEITPEGIKREKDVVRDASITHLTAKRLDMFTIGLIVVALVFILADRFWLSPRLAEQLAAPALVVTETVQTLEPESQVPSKSIAVLPFVNMSDDPGNEYFTDGMHDELLTRLTHVSALKVISRTSVMRYRDTDKSLPEIARELSVATILQGGVQRVGKQVRINVQLINAHTDEHLWAKIYDRELTTKNLFGIQSEISKAIAGALQAQLSPAALASVEEVLTDNTEAYDLYLQAMNKARQIKRVPDTYEAMKPLLERAVALDPISCGLRFFWLRPMAGCCGQVQTPIASTGPRRWSSRLTSAGAGRNGSRAASRSDTTTTPSNAITHARWQRTKRLRRSFQTTRGRFYNWA